MQIEELNYLREKLRIQMHGNELSAIAESINWPVNFLVFGLGNDSALWRAINNKGRTVFIEDNPDWFGAMKGKVPFLEAYLVNYGTKRSEWKEFLEHPGKLYLDLPAAVLITPWDAILVDAPSGYNNDTPGRMKSIYMASLLIKNNGDIFVHDCDREVEARYCDRFLSGKKLLSETTGLAVLRHYR